MTTSTKANPSTMYWSVRRELWENRSIYMAPLAVAGVLLLGTAIGSIGLPHRRRAVLLLAPALQRAAIERTYYVAAAFLIAAAFIVGFFYCLDALHGERRDRSILFWKSLPVSDFTTVLSKASIPLVVLPVLVFVIVLAVNLFTLLFTSVILLGSGMSAASQWRFVPSPFILIYTLIAIALWHAPLYAFVLLVSGWARRAAFLWSVLPFLLIGIFERMAFRTSYFDTFVRYRLFGWYTRAFVVAPAEGRFRIGSPTALDPGTFLTSPGLWVGLGAAAILLTAAVELRRYREPI